MKCLNLCRPTTARPHCHAQSHNFNMTPNSGIMRNEKSAQGGQWRKEIGFQTGSSKAYNTPYRSTSKAFVYFHPIVIPHKFQTSLWQHDWWACHCECQEKWSLNLYLGVSHCVWDLRFMEEYDHFDEHYSLGTKGTLIYCQMRQAARYNSSSLVSFTFTTNYNVQESLYSMH